MRANPSALSLSKNILFPVFFLREITSTRREGRDRGFHALGGYFAGSDVVG
jgi:hypothetical protein